jgi:hypothetical protein
MRLWREILRGLWAVGISSLILLATVEILYRPTFTRLPHTLLGDTVPVLLTRPPGMAERGAVPLLRRLMPWTLLRVLTALLKARKGQAALSFKGRRPTEWTWLLRPEGPSAQGLRGLSAEAFCWSRSEELPLPVGGSTSAARCSRFCAARGLAASPSSASFS